MRYFLDTEFIERPCTIDLISIGIVAEDGREYYAINRECDFSKASDWVKLHVISTLPAIKRETYSLGPGVRGLGVRTTHVPPEYKSIMQMRQEILDFVGQDTPEFWGYYADYDWVAFCWLFGTMMELPKGWPMYCRDLKQLVDQNVFKVQLPRQTEGPEHHALADARHIKKCYDFLVQTRASA